jgi:ribonucleoside-triphosphate reductase
MGTILSSRRSAEICLLPYGHPEWREFALAKRNWWENNPQRAQSNNSLVFYSKPSYDQLSEIFDLMKEAGGSEPGFINGETALKRAPWFKGCNPLKLAA